MGSRNRSQQSHAKVQQDSVLSSTASEFWIEDVQEVSVSALLL